MRKGLEYLEIHSLRTYLETSYLIIHPLLQLSLAVTLAYLFLNDKKAEKPIGKTTFYISGTVLIVAINLTLLIAAPTNTNEEIQARQSFEEKKSLAIRAKSQVKLDLAIRQWEKIIQTILGFWVPYLKIGIIFTEKKDVTKAIENLKIAYRYNPKQNGINFFLGINFSAVGELDKAEFYFRQAIRSTPKNPIS
jgi:tetratricopeptide (TPR) repeat protein|tara:strand:- start:88 stop:666 length:579 start_codon:yes stop_codon:yes gene_type:complete